MGKPLVAPSDDFIPVSVCSREYQVPPSSLTRAVMIGDLEVRLLPGRSPLYSRAGVERLAAAKRERARLREERAKKAAKKKAG